MKKDLLKTFWEIGQDDHYAIERLNEYADKIFNDYLEKHPEVTEEDREIAIAAYVAGVHGESFETILQ